MQFEVFLVRCGVISADALVDAIEQQLASRPLFGRLALQLGELSLHQVAEILERQCDVDKPFGETAIDLGYLIKPQVDHLLQQQRERTPSVVDCLVQQGSVDGDRLDEYRERFRTRMVGHSATPQTTA